MSVSGVYGMSQKPTLKGSLLFSDDTYLTVDIDYLCEKYTAKDRDGVDFPLFSFDEEKGMYSFPRSAVDYCSEFVDCRTTGRSIEILGDSKYFPRDAQRGIVTKTFRYLAESLGGILVAGCGMGKTILASELILRMGLPACVLVHKEFLAEQWVAAFKMLFSEYKVGVLKQGREDTGNEYEVVIASTQSITSPTRKYSEEFYNSFGILVADEVHRYGASVWQAALSKFPAMYRLGLTATPHRYDGLWRVIDEHIGKIGVELKSDPIPNKVFLVPMKTPVDTDSIEKPWLNDTQRRAKLITLLAENESRNKVIARNVLKAYKASRFTLIISERRKQLDTLSKMLIKSGVPKDHIGFYVGGMKSEARKVSVTKPVILTTYQMTKEGLDIERLDTLFLGTPQGNVLQTVGRILRVLSGKALPTTVDFVDTNVELAMGLAFARLRNYKKMKCKIEGELRTV